MFIAPSVYSRSVDYIDLPDIECFKQALRLAIDHVNPDATKFNAPVVFASLLSKQTQAETEAAPRSLMTSDRIRRKFIILDIDYNAGQEQLLDLLVEQVKCFSDKYSTYAMIYPTLSYPAKPRVRIVFFTKRVMTDIGYFKAVTWLCKQLGYDLTDESDTRMSMNRNIPWFSNDDQVAAVWHNFDNENLEPLDNKLWAAETAPVKHKPIEYPRNDSVSASSFNVKILKDVLRDYAIANDLNDYSSVWRLIESIAAEVLNESIDLDDVACLMDALADVATNKEMKLKWSMGNIELFNKSLNALQSGSRTLSQVKPLLAFSPEFFKAIDDMKA